MIITAMMAQESRDEERSSPHLKKFAQRETS